jgi:hypothetical protein
MSLNQQINSSLVIKQQQQGGTSPLPNSSVTNANIISVADTKVYGVTAGCIPYVFAGDVELDAKPTWCD